MRYRAKKAGNEFVTFPQLSVANKASGFRNVDFGFRNVAIRIPIVLQHSEIRNPHSEIHIPKSLDPDHENLFILNGCPFRSPIFNFRMVKYTRQKVVLGYNGRTDWADRADSNGFFLIFHGFQAHAPRKIRVNPPDSPNPFSHRITTKKNLRTVGTMRKRIFKTFLT